MLLMGGSSISWLLVFCRLEYGPCWGCGKGWWGFGGLARCWVLRDRLHVCVVGFSGGWTPFFYLRGGCRVVVGVGWCFENCTVDASIFVVVKFLRAHGGCLGIRNR